MSATDQETGDRTKAKHARFTFNPLWLVDLLGLAGLGAFAWTVASPETTPWTAYAAPVRELFLLLVGCALVVRVLAAVLKRRDRRGDARRELLRRLSGLNETMRDLRTSLSRDRARAFLDRRGEYEAGIRLAGRWLTTEEIRLAEGCAGFCDHVASGLSEAVGRRTDFTGAANRLVRTIERAAADDDLDPDDADNLIGLVRDGMGVMDMALYAEWNADHYGRLSADRRAFAREIGRYASDAADRIERTGLELFDHLIGHVNRKVEVVDMILEWDEGFRKLEARLAGLKPSAQVVSLERARAARPRVADRFIVAPASDGSRQGSKPRLRLPAAND
jgi:hypothetical protein